MYLGHSFCIGAATTAAGIADSVIKALIRQMVECIILSVCADP